MEKKEEKEEEDEDEDKEEERGAERRGGEGGKRPFKNAIGVIIGPETGRYLGDI